jgi:serine/threonine protein kinase
MRWQRYDVEAKPAHAGVLGKLYFGTDTELQRPVAIKKVGDIEAGRREARALAAVSGHEGVLAVFDFFEFGEDGFIVTERVDGKPLGDDERGKKRSQAFAVDLTMNLLRVLRHVHARGYLHTDIKPQNILLPKDGAPPVKLVDFGGAAKLGADGVFRGMSEAGFPPYMAPEQFEEPAVLDESSDLYQAAGVCAYLLTGRPPIDPPDIEAEKPYYAECRRRHMKGFQRDIANDDLRQVVVRALHPDRATRYRRAQDLIDALRPFASEA